MASRIDSDNSADRRTPMVLKIDLTSCLFLSCLSGSSQRNVQDMRVCSMSWGEEETDGTLKTLIRSILGVRILLCSGREDSDATEVDSLGVS